MYTFPFRISSENQSSFCASSVLLLPSPRSIPPVDPPTPHTDRSTATSTASGSASRTSASSHRSSQSSQNTSPSPHPLSKKPHDLLDLAVPIETRPRTRAILHVHRLLRLLHRPHIPAHSPVQLLTRVHIVLPIDPQLAARRRRVSAVELRASLRVVLHDRRGAVRQNVPVERLRAPRHVRRAEHRRHARLDRLSLHCASYKKGKRGNYL